MQPRMDAKKCTIRVKSLLRCITLKRLCPLKNGVNDFHIYAKTKYMGKGYENARAVVTKSVLYCECSFSTNETPRIDTPALRSRTNRRSQNVTNIVVAPRIVPSYSQPRIKETAQTVLSVIDRLTHRAWSTLHLGPESPSRRLPSVHEASKNASRNCACDVPIRCAIREYYFYPTGIDRHRQLFFEKNFVAPFMSIRKSYNAHSNSK